MYRPWGIGITSSTKLDWPCLSTVEKKFRLKLSPVVPSGETLHLASDLDGNSDLVIRQDGSRLFWTWRDHVASINSQNKHITYFGPSAQIESFLERVVLPTWRMIHSPALVFHASAVVSPSGNAFALLGPSGTGKSSTALGLVDHGFTVITDDMLILDGNDIAVAAPAMRLCGAGAQDEDYSGSGKSRHLIPTPDDLGGPITWINLKRGPNAMQRLTESQAFLVLASRRFDLSEWSPQLRAQQFEMLGEVVRQTSAYEFSFQTDPNGLPAHVPALVEALNAIDS